MFLKKLLFVFFVLLSQGILAQETIKMMAYNILNFPTAPPTNRTIILKNILDVYQPDLLMVNELETEAGGQQILLESFQASTPHFNRSQFVPIQSDPQTDNPLQQMVFYNTKKLILENEEIYKTTVRDINRYTFLLNTQDQATNPVRLEVFVTHLKSSDGTANKQIRLNMVTVFTDALNNVYPPGETHAPINPNSYVLFAGDMNFYTSSEPAYQKLLNSSNTNVTTMVDVLNTTNVLQSWNNNSTYQGMHTQATRQYQFGGFGAHSGMDDRFDFIFLSDNMINNPELEYVPNSYHSFGNNGNCYDKSVNDASCNGNYPFSLRDNLFYMSDHLPVVMTLQTNEQFLSRPDFQVVGNIKFPEGNMPKTYLNLQVDHTITNDVSFTIYNVLGQKIMAVKNNNSVSYLINVRDLPNGIYYLQPNLSGSTTYKFLKIN